MVDAPMNDDFNFNQLRDGPRDWMQMLSRGPLITYLPRTLKGDKVLLP